MATGKDAMEEETTETETTETETTAPWTVMPKTLWTLRESTWLVAQTTPRVVGTWAELARAFEDEFGYQRTEKSLMNQAARLRAEPERLERQPLERQGTVLDDARKPWSERESTWLAAVTGKILCWAGVARAFKDEFGYARTKKALKRQAQRLRAEPERMETLAQRKRERDRDANFHGRPWTSSEEQWLAAAVSCQINAPGDTRRGSLDWQAIAIAFKDEFGHERSGAALRNRSETCLGIKRAKTPGPRAGERARRQMRELLQQRDTSAEVFELLGIEG